MSCFARVIALCQLRSFTGWPTPVPPGMTQFAQQAFVEHDVGDLPTSTPSVASLNCSDTRNLDSARTFP
jgi:hypothetical protein